MLQIQMQILRVFGLPSAEVSSIVRTAREEGCPSLRLKERDGEYLVCIQASAPTQAMADEYCDRWTRKIRDRFGDAVYGMGDTTLAQATLDALLKKRRLLVAADELTGRLLGGALRGLEHSEAAFDFGTQTYSSPLNAKRIVAPAALLKKFPGDVVQAAAGRAQIAMELAGADYAAVYMPATVGQAPFVLLCSKQGAAACALSPDLTDTAIANNILDLVRRRALGLHLSGSTITFRPGREHPLLLVSGEGQPRAAGTRFTVRRKPAALGKSAVPRPGAENPVPVGTITFESPIPASPAPAASNAPAQPQEEPPSPDPTELTTMGAAAAAASRARRAVPQGSAAASAAEPVRPAEVPAAPQPRPAAKPNPPKTARPPKPAASAQIPKPSLLDGEIPDFSAALDPAAMEAARIADEKAPPRSADEFQRAASRLFEEQPEEPARQPAAPEKTASPRTVSPPRSTGSIHNRSLAMIEQAEKRRRRNGILALVAVALLLVAAVAGIALWLRSDLGAEPAYKSYGTSLYDEAAADYLASALEKKEDVAGYLAYPGQKGMLVYRQGAQQRPVFQATSYLGAAMPGNTVLICAEDSLNSLTELETFRSNSGFTLYLPGAVYRCKTVAVYYAGEGEDFDPRTFGDLSNYYDYLSFTLSLEARSLFDTGVVPGDGASFLTLMATGGDNGAFVCVTGQILGEGESASLQPSSIEEAENPLLTRAQYRAAGKERPAAAGIFTGILQRRAASAQSGAGQPESGTAPEDGTAAQSGDSDLQAELDALSQRTQELLASADKLMAGLTDVAGNSDAAETSIGQGAEGTLPEQTVTVDDVIQAAATPAPTQAPAASETAQPTAEPTPQPVETINVTMNGTARTMELVECLAMIAQNELGPNAPAEAYKAQCVAAHCWIISQSGYPSVAGVTPGEAALAAAREVAHVLVTYNGQVCFTPYFASASTGTASAREVWGNDRPYLQAVDSPYDQQVATHWNTNGATTGCARFSRQTVQDRVLEKMGVDLSSVDPSQWFTILSANQYGWVAQIQIGPNASGNDTCSGRWFREVLLAGASVDGRSLRSQCFTVTYDSGLDCFLFDVYGYGHGCGMSQWGAVGYARNGWDYASILTHYYPGTTLTTY